MKLHRVYFWVCVAGFVGGSNLCLSQTSADQRHLDAVELLKQSAAQITTEALTGFQTLEDWQNQRSKLKEQFLYMLGLNPLPDRTPLRLQITATLERQDYWVENIVFQSLPGLYVTGNLYRPKGVGARPTILYVCGHSPHPQGAKYQYQDRGIWFAEHGYVCFVIDTLEFAEVPGIHHGLHDLNRWDWLSRGYTPAGVEVWNAMRAIDYLRTRPEVDGDRIGITGISGGGAVSWYAAAADERISVSVPVCGTFTFGSQAENWLASRQCDCIYFHNTFLQDLSTVAALIAPRPLLLCSGRRDSIFPPDGYHEVFRQAKQIFDLQGASDRIKEVDEDVGHSDSPFLRSQTRQWLNRWLVQDDSSVPIQPNPSEKEFSPDDLRCLDRLPRDAINYRIDESFVPRATLRSYGTLSEWFVRRAGLFVELSDKTFRWFPDQTNPFHEKRSQRGGGWATRYADYEEVQFETEPGVTIRVQLFKVRQRTKETPLLIYAKRAGDTLYFMDLDELLPLLGRCDIAVVYPRLTEHPVTGVEFADIERTAVWSGRTVASMQVWDLLRTVEWLSADSRMSNPLISIYGKGEMGIVSLYAAALDQRISQVILRDPPSSHGQGPALLNVLRFTDIPEVAAMIAPRRLTFLSEIPTEFEFTRVVFNYFEPSTGLSTAGSLPEAMEVWKY